MESRHGAEGAGLSIVRGRSLWPLGHTPGGRKPRAQSPQSAPPKRASNAGVYDPSVARYDVIVVGAGPAGSTTAYRLARAGARVRLLDRARFPRDKPCGGGLTLRAVRELPVSVEPVVEERVDTLELGLRYSRRWSRRASEPLVLMTQRRRLDAFLAEQAAAAGAEFRDDVNVGVGGWQSEGPHLRERLRELCGAFGIDEAAVHDLRGHRLPMRGAARRPVHGRVLLVGDAAGLVDPLSGDGMYEAFVSGRLAADAVLDLLEGRAQDLEPYARDTIAALGPNAAASWSAKVALDRFPRLAFVVAPLAWPTVSRLVRGEIDRPGQARGLARAPLGVLKRLAVQAGDRGAAFRSALPQS